MPRSVAINIGANTNAPGFRGPIYDDGSFEYVPIPEEAPTTDPVPTYADLGLSMEIPAEIRETPVHLDPEFADYGPCENYTYGDPFGVKARPLQSLEAGDFVYFYATLSTAGDDPAPWIAPRWGCYIIGQFELARDPVSGDDFDELSATEKAAFASNAHLKRDPFDARVLLRGDPNESRLFDRAFPLSTPEAGATANHAVTEWSSDSGKGPWWRRPLRFDESATEKLRAELGEKTQD
ncbi:hypothetical protein [Haladaptatus sp. DYSN1]|uniref:Nmad3 family putative nucleotide modification protein n=1 Tax=unclassified Haladaptatus TaxID=2622732 RepID=UPI0024072AAE|nr:hypothetical protein [Haladaptatus sp. DYSN1]